MSDTPDDQWARRVATRWAAIVPILFFLTGSGGFMYEVVAGHSATWALFCAIWAAGGPALLADRLIRSLR